MPPPSRGSAGAGAADRRVENLKRAQQAQIERFERRLAVAQTALDEYNANRPVLTFLRFARLCAAARTALAADVYVAHGVQALPAAALLAHVDAKRHMCDVIEIPSFQARAEPSKWQASNVEFVDRALESYLRHADGLITIGAALGERLAGLHARVSVIPNYRRAETLVRSNALRQRCGVGEEASLVVAISNVSSGFELVLEALARLPRAVHLATIGRFSPPDYRARCFALAERLGVMARWHCLDPVPYAELASFASAADVGLVVRDPGILNNQISLPNRIFDYMAASLPVCSPDIPDIARLITRWEMGMVVRDASPAAWAAAIAEVLSRRAAMAAQAGRAAAAHVWEALEEPLHDALGRPRSVTFLGLSHLCDNNRTVRMARSLAARGVQVTLASPPPRGDSVTRNEVSDAGIRVENLQL